MVQSPQVMHGDLLVYGHFMEFNICISVNSSSSGRTTTKPVSSLGFFFFLHVPTDLNSSLCYSQLKLHIACTYF